MDRPFYDRNRITAQLSVSGETPGRGSESRARSTGQDKSVPYSQEPHAHIIDIFFGYANRNNGGLHLMCDFSMACTVAMEEPGGRLSSKVLPSSERERELEGRLYGYHIVNIPCIGRLAGTELSVMVMDRHRLQFLRQPGACGGFVSIPSRSGDNSQPHKGSSRSISNSCALTTTPQAYNASSIISGR